MNVFEFSRRVINLIENSGACDYEPEDESMGGIAYIFSSINDRNYDDVVAALGYFLNDNRDEITIEAEALIKEVAKMEAEW